jgi:hypothetical protein
MRAVVVKPASAVRRRIVDAPLPAVIVMPSRAVGTAAHGTLAVDPTGMNLADWREEVQKQYNLNPRAYPQLTPGMHCFWDCVASFGGTPHMWYSWWMAFSKRKPATSRATWRTLRGRASSRPTSPRRRRPATRSTPTSSTPLPPALRKPPAAATTTTTTTAAASGEDGKSSAFLFRSEFSLCFVDPVLVLPL